VTADLLEMLFGIFGNCLKQDGTHQISSHGSFLAKGRVCSVPTEEPGPVIQRSFPYSESLCLQTELNSEEVSCMGPPFNKRRSFEFHSPQTRPNPSEDLP